MWNNCELVFGYSGAYHWWCVVLYSAKMCLIVYLCRLVISQTAEYHLTIRCLAIYMVHVHWRVGLEVIYSCGWLAWILSSTQFLCANKSHLPPIWYLFNSHPKPWRSCNCQCNFCNRFCLYATILSWHLGAAGALLALEGCIFFILFFCLLRVLLRIKKIELGQKKTSFQNCGLRLFQFE